MLTLPRLALGLFMVVAAVAASAQDPDDALERARGFLGRNGGNGSAKFPVYHALLRSDAVVVFGRLKSLGASKKKRVNIADVVTPKKQQGGVTMSQSSRVGGSQFYHADGKSTVRSDAVLHGSPASKTVKLRYKLQIEKTGDGKTRYVMLGRHAADLHKKQYGLWILHPQKKPKGTFRIARLIAMDEKGGKSKALRAAFQKKQGDYFEVNLQIRFLLDALQAARKLHEGGDAEQAAKVLKKALESKLKVKSIDFEDEAKKAVAPYRKKVDKMLKDLEKAAAKRKPE